MPVNLGSAREPRAWSRPPRLFKDGKEFECSLLGVSVSYLETEFIQEVEAHFGTGADPNYHDIKDKMLIGETAKGKGKRCPRDGWLDCSYVDAIPVPHSGKATVIISWCWQSTVRTVVTALSRWCHKARKDPEDVFVWQCALCHNHFRDVRVPLTLSSEMKPATSRSSEPPRSLGSDMPAAGYRSSEPLPMRQDSVASVYDAISRFQWRIRNIGTLLVIFSPLEPPLYLNRIWCLFEFFTVCAGQQADVHILLSEADEVVFREAIRGKGLLELNSSISKVRIQEAETSCPKDIEGIVRLLRANMKKQALLADGDVSSVAVRNLSRGQVAYRTKPLSPQRQAGAAGIAPRSQSVSHPRDSRRSSDASGTPLQSNSEACVCGAPFAGKAKFCSECGARRPATQATQPASSTLPSKHEDAEPELAAVNKEIANVFKRWLFDKAQAELQQQIANQGYIPLEAFANVAGLLCTDPEFEPLGFLVLQQGLRFGQATCATEHPGYALLLRDMGTCLSNQGRHQQALSHFLAARCVYENGHMFGSPEYADLLVRISQNASAAASSVRKSLPMEEIPAVRVSCATIQTSETQTILRQHVPDTSSILQDPSCASIVQEPLADIRSTLICMPTCHCNPGQPDLSQVIDLQREDTKDLAFAHVVPVLPLAKDQDLKDVAGAFGATDVVDFSQLTKERSRLAADRRNRRLRDGEFLEPTEPADVGVLDMLLQWTSKIGFGLSGSSNCNSHGGGPALLQGCRNRTVSGDEEWI